LSSSCYSLPGNGFRFGTYGPNKSQEFATYRCDDLSLVFARGRQSCVSLVQSVLRLPRNLFSLFRYALLPFAQPGPDGRRAMITPCRFDDDPSQVRVASLCSAAAPGSLATGVLARYSAANNPSVLEHLQSERDLAQPAAIDSIQRRGVSCLTTCSFECVRKLGKSVKYRFSGLCEAC
jgi:hypothetical protein